MPADGFVSRWEFEFKSSNCFNGKVDFNAITIKFAFVYAHETNKKGGEEMKRKSWKRIKIIQRKLCATFVLFLARTSIATQSPCYFSFSWFGKAWKTQEQMKEQRWMDTYSFVEHTRLSIFVGTFRTVDEAVTQNMIINASVSSLAIWCWASKSFHAIGRGRTFWRIMQKMNRINDFPNSFAFPFSFYEKISVCVLSRV